MKKNDTPLYKIKVCAVSILLCGLFTVLAVGCSNQNDNDPDNTMNNQEGNVNFPEGSTVPKITLPNSGSSSGGSGSNGSGSGGFNLGRPIESGATFDESNKMTIGPINIVPITRPDPTEPPETGTVGAENTRFDIELPRGTLNTEGFDIVDDTTATMVYGFND